MQNKTLLLFLLTKIDEKYKKCLDLKGLHIISTFLLGEYYFGQKNVELTLLHKAV